MVNTRLSGARQARHAANATA